MLRKEAAAIDLEPSAFVGTGRGGAARSQARPAAGVDGGGKPSEAQTIVKTSRLLICCTVLAQSIYGDNVLWLKLDKHTVYRGA
jgi:hypothetical protein